MAANFSQKIRELREAQGVSQEQMAKQLKMTRQTYTQIENGKRDIKLAEAQKLASVLGFSLERFITGKSPNPEITVKLPPEKPARGGSEMRIIVPRSNLQKFREVLLYVLEKVGALPHVGETAIYKLLYFIDFDYYEKHEEQLIGATYIKNRFGPTPVEFRKIIDRMERTGEIARVHSKYFKHEQKKYLPLRDPDLQCLSARELAHIDEVLARLSGKNGKELSDYSHQDVPWISAKNGERLDYETVFYRTPKTSVRNYDDSV